MRPAPAASPPHSSSIVCRRGRATSSCAIWRPRRECLPWRREGPAGATVFPGGSEEADYRAGRTLGRRPRGVGMADWSEATALIVVDVQKGFDDAVYWGLRNSPRCEEDIRVPFS